MAKTEEIRVEGLDELAKALKELPKRLARNGLRASVYAGAKVIRDEARLKAPVATRQLGPNQQPPGTLLGRSAGTGSTGTKRERSGALRTTRTRSGGRPPRSIAARR